MSGGHFDHKEHNINYIIEELEEALNRCGKEIPVKERWNDKYWYEKYPEDAFYPDYPDEVKDYIRMAIDMLSKSYTLVHKLDRMFSGDSSPESFLSVIKRSLEMTSWFEVYEKTPPINEEIIAMSPNGGKHLTSWRESYKIFMCQSKTDSTDGWKWKRI